MSFVLTRSNDNSTGVNNMGKGINHGKSIMSRQMEYAAMRQRKRIELSELRNRSLINRPQKFVEQPAYIPPNKEQLMAMLHPVNKYQISIKEENKEPIIINRTGRKEMEKTMGTLARMKKYIIEKVGKWK